jgi:hypothetical protein
MRPTVYTNRTVTRRAVRAADVRLVIAVAICGSVAAVVADSALWLSTAAVVGLLVLAIQRVSESDVRDDARLRALPLPLQRTLRATLAALPAGDAKRLLNEVGRQAAVLFSSRPFTFDDPWERSARQNVSELVEAACNVAQEMARLDRAFPPGTPTAADESLLAQALASRRLFEGRLEDAASALAAMYAAGVQHGTPASDRVAELVQEIRADAAATSYAGTELNRLLDGPRRAP